MTSRRCRRWWIPPGARAGVVLLLAAMLGAHLVPLSPDGPRPAVSPAAGLTWLAPLDVCDAGGPSAGLLADLPLLPPAVTEIVAAPCARPLPAADLAALPVGFAPGVYRPPRLVA